MKIKKYTAPSIAEAMKLIRNDLGEDAVIINSRVVVTKKLFGLLKQKNFEVLAGVDTIEKKQTLPISNSNAETVIHKPINQDFSVEQNENISAELRSEIAELKKMLQSIHRKSVESEMPEQLMPFIQFLKRQEFNPMLITAISDELFIHFNRSHNELTTEQMVDATKQILRKKLSHLPFGGISYNKKFINVLGPTGVGKTTTIAKMAARSVLEKKKKIGFITTDTYRIAAIDQLKTYANLLQAPVEVVYNLEDYQKAIEKLSHLDLIFIDTAGRNYKESKYVKDLKSMLNFDNEVESFLVLSLTSKEKDMESIIEQFEEFPIQKFIFTKLDETNSLGAIGNLMIKYNKGLAYYTNGQEVPEDIEEATLEELLNLFFQGEFK